jgi:hypothetical protein
MNGVPLDGLCCGRSELLLFLRFDEKPREDFNREAIRSQALGGEGGTEGERRRVGWGGVGSGARGRSEESIKSRVDKKKGKDNEELVSKITTDHRDWPSTFT